MVQKKPKKINVGFILSPNANWIGEKNYFRSLISALNDSADLKEILITVFVSKYDKTFDNRNFHNIKLVKTSFLNNKGFFLYVKKISSYFFKKYDPLIYILLKLNSVNILSHYKPMVGFKNISWFPDFQHVHYPNFFSGKELLVRDRLYRNYINNSDILIVSSKASKKDLKIFCTKNKKIEVLNFVPEIDFSLLQKKIHLKKYINQKLKYIFSPNQFWLHKNHKCIIEALNILKKKKIKTLCLFSGNNYDHRNPDNFKNLIKKIKNYRLDNQIKYLGILPYKQIINLIYHSNIIINPSFFEGWSTTVEEAKILDKDILLSNIQVHKEQNPKKALYFNPRDANDLAKKIIIKMNKTEKKTDDHKLIIEYKKKRKEFSLKYINIIKNLKF